MNPSSASVSVPCHITQQAIANVEQAMRKLRASRNFYPQQAKAILLTYNPDPNNNTHPLPTEPTIDSEPPVFNALKRRMRQSKEIIETICTDMNEAGNLVKMLKKGSWA